MSFATVSISVQVTDPAALHAAALASLIANGHEESEALDIIGEPSDPFIGSCLRELLDPGESPAGCKIIDSHCEQA